MYRLTRFNRFCETAGEIPAYAYGALIETEEALHRCAWRYGGLIADSTDGKETILIEIDRYARRGVGGRLHIVKYDRDGDNLHFRTQYSR